MGRFKLVVKEQGGSDSPWERRRGSDGGVNDGLSIEACRELQRALGGPEAVMTRAIAGETAPRLSAQMTQAEQPTTKQNLVGTPFPM